MKLKLVVASMSVLGLMSCPVFAASHAQYDRPKNAEENYNYKGEALVATTCPKVDPYQPLLDLMSQNVYRAKPTVDCNKPIQFAGGINFDYQMLGPLNHGIMGENPNRFALNDAYLNATAHINSWISAFIELSYSSITGEPLLPSSADGIVTPGAHGANEPLPGLYSAAYNLNNLNLQQGYIFIGDLERFPLFLKLGKQFQDFGRYVIHPITRSMTQVMTETLQTSAELSFISPWNSFDFHGSAFTFQNTLGMLSSGELGGEGSGHHHTNYGAQIGFGKINDQLGFDVGVGYIYDMVGVNDIGYAVSLFNDGDIDADGSYHKRVNGLTVYGTFNTGPFSFSGHYVTALQHFSPVDLGFTTDEEDDFDGAKPWAWDLTAAYGFNYFSKAQNLYVGFQQSGDAANLFLPRDRWLVGYGIDVLKNTNLSLEYTYDKNYDESDGGNGENSNRVAIRVATRFG